MGLFTKRKKQKQVEPAAVAEQVFDASYRDELRQMGRAHFQGLLEESSADLKTDVDAVLENLTGALRRHMASQIDLSITRINNDISNQFREQMNEYNRVSREAQDLVVQSLSRNAQSIHEKYQEMTTNLQQVVANQEVMMVGVFQENRNRVNSVQEEQSRVLQSISDTASRVQTESERLNQNLQQAITDQSEKLGHIYHENLSRVESTKQQQAEQVESLTRSTQALEQQHEQLRQLLDESIVNQKNMVTELINENMARIVEHYLIGALGEQSELAAQVPSIIERMEENKQAMVDDMRL